MRYFCGMLLEQEKEADSIPNQSIRLTINKKYFTLKKRKSEIEANS